MRPLIDQNAKEGKDKKVVFECGFSKPNCKPKWTFRKDVRLLGVIEAEVVNNSMIFYSQELFTGSKYKFKNEGDSYQLIIMTPKVEDTGKYTIDIGGVSSTAFLNVDEPDPVYSFVKMLKKKHEGFTDHDTTLECAVSSNMAIVSWFKGTTKLEDGDVYSISKELSGICKLTIKNCKLTDTGDYSCRIEKQTDRTDTKLHIIGKRNLSLFFLLRWSIFISSAMNW